MTHPTLKLTVFVDKSDYHEINRSTPNFNPSNVTVVTDIGAQSCLWGLSDFLRCGFNAKDLIPVKLNQYTNNKGEIDILGAILIRLSGTKSDGDL